MGRSSTPGLTHHGWLLQDLAQATVTSHGIEHLAWSMPSTAGASEISDRRCRSVCTRTERPPKVPMIHASLQLLLYALLAGFSALTFAATIAVMQAGRLKTLGFGTGFVLGQVFTCSLFVIVGVAVTGASTRTHSTLIATLEVLFALLLIAVALRARRAPRIETEGSSERTQAVLERLSRMRLVTTSIAGFLLGIGGPKRLLLTALAATAITSAGVRDVGETALIVWYCGLATVLVWGPVIVYMLLGDRAVGVMTRAQRGLARRQPGVKVYAILLLAGLLILDAISLLL